MSITAKKIINSLLMIMLVVLLAGLAYYFTGKERLLTGDILSDLQEDYLFVQSINFVDPYISAFPVNDIVTIDSVYVKFELVAMYDDSLMPIAFAMEDGILSGSDIVLSPIIFAAAPDNPLDNFPGTLPDGVIINENEIIVPNDLSETFYIDIYLPDDGTPMGQWYEMYIDDSDDDDPDRRPDRKSTSSLAIVPVDCSGLQASIMKGTGTAVFTGDPDELPTSAVSLPFDFGEVTDETASSAEASFDFSEYINSVRDITQLVIENPVTTGITPGSKQFTLTFNFDNTGATDHYSFDDPAVCDMSIVSACSITIDSQTLTDAVENFDGAINAITNSAFDASYAGNTVTLEATDTGEHTNDYTYTLTLANISTPDCENLDDTTDPLCADTTGCTWSPEACTGDLISCAGIPPLICSATYGCLTEGSDCVGTLACDGPTEPYCESVNGCTWDTECTGEPACDGLAEGLCTAVSDCTWNLSECAGTPDADCGGLTGSGQTACESTTDALDCTWNAFDSECVPENPIVIECDDCFAGGTDPEASPISSIIISNPSPPEEAGQQTFNITLDFVSDLTERADITYSSGSGDYEIDVRDEGLDDTSGTASNFVYVFNDLLGGSSPFFASIDPLNSSGVILTTKELGVHTNDYNCNANDLPFPNEEIIVEVDFDCDPIADDSQDCIYEVGKCFDQALAGEVDVLTVPITLDNSMTQGETALVYVAGSIGENEWVSSSPSVLEVALLSEVEDGPSGSSAQFLTAPLTGVGDPNLGGGTYTVTDCETEYDGDTPLDTTCNIYMSIPVEFNVPSGLTALVTVGSDTVEVPLEGDGYLIGTIEGSGVWSDNSVSGGFNQTLTGTVLGTVTGYASDGYEGMVHGTITAEVSANAQLAHDITPSELGISLFPTMGTTEATSLLTASEPFTSTVTAVEEVVTDIAILYAKRPGTSVLTVTDAQNCTAILEVEVVGQAVILQMVDQDPEEVLEVGDTVLINAYLGDEEGGVDEMQNITTDPETQWHSSNESVATVSSGILTAVAPGVTQITASYNTGVAEIGEIFSDPLTVTVNQLTGLTIALDEDMKAFLPVEIVEQAYESVLLAIHQPTVIGKTITVEGQAIPISSLGIIFPDGASDLEKVDLIADALEVAIENIAEASSQVVNVARLTDLPGILLLEPTAHQSTAGAGLMHNGIIDITTTANQNQVSIIPNFSAGLDLPADETYELMVVADYANGRTKRLSATDVTWVNTPVNYLEQASLDTGLLKFGEIAGTSTVKAEFVNPDMTKITSNSLTVTVTAGPVIEFVHRIGSGPITQGSQIDLQVKVTDVDTIADIQDISISLVKSNFNTYNQINSDPAAIWFDVTTYPDEIIVVDEGEEEDADEDVLVFKTYNLPVDIPLASNLFDGNYKLIISITDTDNHTLNYVYPIYIGEMASGDVNGDSVVNMIDVILAFQIAAGTIDPTPAQLDAADVNNQGGVTMVDVILLFQQASSA